MYEHLSEKLKVTIAFDKLNMIIDLANEKK